MSEEELKMMREIIRIMNDSVVQTQHHATQIICIYGTIIGIALLLLLILLLTIAYYVHKSLRNLEQRTQWQQCRDYENLVRLLEGCSRVRLLEESSGCEGHPDGYKQCALIPYVEDGTWTELKQTGEESQ